MGRFHLRRATRAHLENLYRALIEIDFHPDDLPRKARWVTTIMKQAGASPALIVELIPTVKARSRLEIMRDRALGGGEKGADHGGV